MAEGTLRPAANGSPARQSAVTWRPANSARMIFVVGSSRSGTTMMGRILGRHTDVFTFNELHFFEQIWNERAGTGRDPGDARLLAARLLAVQRQGYLNKKTPEIFCGEAEALIEDKTLPGHEVFARVLQYEARLDGGSIPCDQTPRNLFYANEILELFPKAVVVNMIRDPRDVLLSQKNKWRRRRLGGASIPLREAIRARINYHPITVTRLWASAVRKAHELAGEPRFISIRFEHLLTDPETEVARVCELAGLEYQPDMLNVPQKGSSVRADDSTATGMDPDRANAWRRGGLSRTEVFLCERIAGHDMRRLDMQLSDPTPNWLALTVLLMLFPVHLVFALFANLHRVGSLSTAIRRRLG